MPDTNDLAIWENVSLAPLTTLGVGGPARYFVRAETEEMVGLAFCFADERGLPVFVLGGGSNILVSDEGFDGLVLQIAIKGIEAAEDADGIARVRAGAGEDWDPFVAYCVERGLAGVECLSGIPGFVGGTPVQNVGAYGQEVSETITKVRCFDRSTGEIVNIAGSDCGFSYRRSIFNSTEKGRYTVLAVEYALRIDGEPLVAYRDLIEHFAQGKPSLAEVREAVIEIRRRKSMVIDPADANSRSAGSFFKNPVIPVEVHKHLESRLRMSVPTFPASEGFVKVPAAWLIENAGFEKGYRLGNAGISTRHTLAIVNLGGATAAEIVDLMREIQSGVNARFGIKLQPEPVFVGF
ncbi:MAG: UDP-N-acetylmuramate dehydrogenase [Pyrinomonadaceae bacterium]|nr:UDP-N-acetylmuramate dehydrogenase [Pyrinomonadaceae bacterium]